MLHVKELTVAVIRRSPAVFLCTSEKASICRRSRRAMEGGSQRSRASLAHREEAVGSRVRREEEEPGKKEEAGGRRTTRARRGPHLPSTAARPALSPLSQRDRGPHHRPKPRPTTVARIPKRIRREQATGSSAGGPRFPCTSTS
jgi:hypothetical protein